MNRFGAFPAAFLGKDELREPIVATIRFVLLEPVKLSGGGEAKKPVMHFHECRPLILNRPNWDFCEERFGPVTEMWRGRQIEIFVDPTITYNNRAVGGIRFRLPAVDLLENQS